MYLYSISLVFLPVYVSTQCVVYSITAGSKLYLSLLTNIFGCIYVLQFLCLRSLRICILGRCTFTVSTKFLTVPVYCIFCHHSLSVPLSQLILYASQAHYLNKISPPPLRPFRRPESLNRS